MKLVSIAISALLAALPVAGVAKDGGLAALREINRQGFAWAQLDAMERFWAGLSRGQVLTRAGEWVTTGTLTAAFPVQAGQTWSTRIDDLRLPGLSVEFSA